jgi:hypothetical protein
MNDKIKILIIIYDWLVSFGEQFGFSHSITSSFINSKVDGSIAGENTNIYLGDVEGHLITYMSYDGETFLTERSIF